MIADAEQVIGSAQVDPAIGNRRRRKHVLSQFIRLDDLCFTIRLQQQRDAIIGREVNQAASRYQ